MEKNTKAAVHLIVHGRVQGVGFRYFTQTKAQDLGLVGWVKNLWDGTVEIKAEGPKQKLKRLVNAVRRGPSTAWVEQVEQEWGAPTKAFTNFTVKH
jgi:acylphosphatase